MRCMLAAGLIALGAASGASAELVARGVSDGLLATTPSGAPVVAYVRGDELVVATRVGRDRWRRQDAAQLVTGSSLVAFAAGAAGPVALVVGPTRRTLLAVWRRDGRWRRTPVVRRLDPGVTLGWPGLALAPGGTVLVAFTRWRERNYLSQLVLARLDRRGDVRAERITLNGWPASFVAPPAAPVVLPGGAVHVIEAYGFSSTVGTIEWMPTRTSWTGQFIDGAVGDFPVGPVFAALGRGGVVYAAWTHTFLAWGDFPVTLASHGRSVDANFVLDRALTTGLAVTPSGPEVAANAWVSASDLGLPSDAMLWAGTVTGRGGSEVDGWIDGLAASPRGDSRDLLLGGGAGLSWFRSPGPLPVRVTLKALPQPGGTIAVSGHVHGAHGGRVTIYRERPGTARQVAAVEKLGPSGWFGFAETLPMRPVLYRAVYTDPATGIPYARLLREPVG
jgi:hypothetical protein